MRIRSLLFAVAALAVIPAAAHAQTTTKGDIVVSSPWARATPAGAEVGGGYLVITNRGTAPERLVSFSTELSDQPEIHEMTHEGGVMKMRPLKAGLAIPPGASVRLEPGGYHLMLMKLKQPLTPGGRFKATLVFEKAGPVEVEFEVRAMGAGSQKGHGAKHGH